MVEKSLIIFYVFDFDNFASKNWLYFHLNDINNLNFDVKIISGFPKKDYGSSLLDFLKLNHDKYLEKIIVTLTTDNHGRFIYWDSIKKYCSHIVIFPLDSISVLSKFKYMIKNVADVVWCPHLQVLKKCKDMNKKSIFLPYGSRRPENIQEFTYRSDDLFFQGTSHGLRKSFVFNLSKEIKNNICVQGNGWTIEKNSIQNSIIKNSISSSFDYFFKKPLKYFPTLIYNSLKNPYFISSVMNYPSRLLGEYRSKKSDNIKIYSQNEALTLEKFKYTLGINFLFSSNYTSYRLRDFEAAAIGSCHFTHNDINLESIYVPDKAMIYYRDIQDLIEKLNFYTLDNVGRLRAKEIAFNARYESKKNTWEERIKSLLTFIRTQQ